MLCYRNDLHRRILRWCGFYTCMASAGAQCDHMNHVSTQLPYAILVAGVSFVGYIIAGFIQNAVVVLVLSLIILIAALYVVNLVTKKKA